MNTYDMTDEEFNIFQEDIARMRPNIGKKGYLTDAIGSLEDHQGYNGELLTITSVTTDAFYVLRLPGTNKMWIADTNEFKILND